MKTLTQISLEPKARLVLLAYASFTVGIIAALALLADGEDFALEIVLLALVTLLPAALLALGGGKRSAISPGVELLPRYWNILITMIVGIFCFAWILLAFFYNVRVSFILHALLQALALLAFLLGGSVIRSAMRKDEANKTLHSTVGNAPV